VLLIYDVVQCYPWVNFYIPLFVFLLIYDNEYETKENKIEPRIKLNYNIYTLCGVLGGGGGGVGG